MTVPCNATTATPVGGSSLRHTCTKPAGHGGKHVCGGYESMGVCRRAWVEQNGSEVQS
jgi:hypothetical protein